MPVSFQSQIYALLNMLALSGQVIVVMDVASVALLLHGVLFASFLALIIKSNFSPQTLLLVAILWNIHSRSLSSTILPRNSKELPYSVENAGAPVFPPGRNTDFSSEEVSSVFEDPTEGYDHQPRAVKPQLELASTPEVATDKNIELESPTKSFLTRCKVRKNVRTRGMRDDDKENEPSPSVLTLAPTVTPPVSRRSGLRPLTLTNFVSHDVSDTSGPRRTVSLFNGVKRLNPLFYGPNGEQDNPLLPLARSPPHIPSRRVSLPPNGLSRIATDSTPRLQDEIKLATRLQEEMKLTARLRDDLVELRDRACAELDQSKRQAQALAVAVDARECYIRDLTAGLDLLRVENKVLKKATRRDLGQNVPTEGTSPGRTENSMELEGKLRELSPMVRTWELGYDTEREKDAAVSAPLMHQAEALGSAQKKKSIPRCVKRSSIAVACASGISKVLRIDSRHSGTAHWFSLGSISEPTLEPPRRSAAAETSPPTHILKYDEYGVDSESSHSTPEEDIEIEFPTISPQFPPRYAAALARKRVATPSPGTVIYEVDGRVLAASNNHIWSSLGSLVDPALSPRHAQMATPQLTGSPHRSINSCLDNICLTPDQDAAIDAAQGDLVVMRKDSPFYAIPASAFVLPRAARLLSGRCP